MIPRDLTYGDFYRTGVQDCGNAIDLDEFDLESGGTAAQIVDRTWSEWEEDDLEGQWRRQQDDFEGLDPHRAYASWRSGWRDCATQLIKCEAPKENPAWVTNIISRHFLELEENVPPQWLPKLTGAKAVRGKLHAAMKEYGCGYYGCVLPTLDDGVVLKLTTDVTESEFARDVAGRLSAPVVVKYRLTRELPDKYKGRQAFLLWRDAAERVGEIAAVVDERGGNGSAAENLVAEQHRAAQEAFEALHEGRPAGRLIERWEQAARKMGKVPELRELAEGMIRNLERDGVFMGDVHSGNLGRVDGRWVVVDPGHVAVLEDG